LKRKKKKTRQEVAVTRVNKRHQQHVCARQS